MNATTSLVSGATSKRTIAVWLNTVSTRPAEPTAYGPMGVPVLGRVFCVRMTRSPVENGGGGSSRALGGRPG
ncbi:MAG: hypothetical protein JOZ92_03305 [Candidatus Dormibacteraeota bacterium]|nr:hypothetical protein [Candidatus Dormibacteraeota bacterium]